MVYLRHNSPFVHDYIRFRCTAVAGKIGATSKYLEPSVMRTLLLMGASLALTSIVIGNAYYQRSQFYPSVVYLTKSNPSMAVLYIQAFVFVIMMGKVMRKIFFGDLRAAEMEHLIERSWYAVTETCLAFTVFRDDFSPRFVASFTVLLFLKCFHWLIEDRVDYMERSPVISVLFHARVLSLLTLLGLLDLYFISHAYYSTLLKGASVQLVFGFEYAILLTAVLMSLMKYILHSIDIQNANPWENKAVYLLYTELVMGAIRMLLYFVFMAIMIKIHTFPLFAIRPMYLSMRSFKKALHDVIMSRRAIRNMNTLYPDATTEELSSTDNVCIICREDMVNACKKLPCNHIFHTSCLRSWFQRQQTCPTCRMDVLRMSRPQTSLVPPAPQAPAPQQPIQAPFNPIFPGYPFAWPPPVPVPQQPVPPVSPGTSATSTTTATTVPSSSSIPAFPMPASAPTSPEFPAFTQMPLLPPYMGSFPQPPVPFTNLSEDELRALEGQERSSVEARILWLRDIQALLDGAMVLIQQYNMVASFSSLPEISVQPTTQCPPASTVGAADHMPAPSDTAEKSVHVSSPIAQSLSETELAAGDEGATAQEWDISPNDEHKDELHEVRRRRLHRFTESPGNTDQPVADKDYSE